MFTYTETIRLIRDGEKGVWRWGERRETVQSTMEVEEEGDYIPIAPLSPPEDSCIRWAAMRTILKGL